MDLLFKAAAFLTGRQWARWQDLTLTPQEVQHDRLLRIIARNRPTKFGREHRFDRIHSLADFRERVAIGDYERLLKECRNSMRKALKRIQAGAMLPDAAE